MANVIIGIEGLANQPAKEIVQEWWEASIREGLLQNSGLQDIDFLLQVVYFADILYREPLHQNPELTNDPLYLHEPYYTAEPKNLVEYRGGWLERLNSFVTGTKVGRPNPLLESSLRDLDFYWDTSISLADRTGNFANPKNVLTSELLQTIRSHSSEGNKIMLIAHSIGSVIAFDVLRDLERSGSIVDIPYLVSIGSPLGFGMIKAEFLRHGGEETNDLQTPSVISNKWVNFADALDPVAIDTHLRDDYSVNALGVQVEDNLVSNDYKFNGVRNHNKSYGYLRTPEISRLIAEFLGLSG